MINPDSADLSALQSTESRRGSVDQDKDMVEKLKTAAPAWTRDGNGVAGPQKPRSYDYPGAGGTEQSVKPLSIQLQSNVRTDPLLSIGGGGGGSSAKISFPFQATLYSDPKTQQDYVTINDESDLMLSYAPDNTMSITGLGSRMRVNIGDLIWLELVITDLLVTSASIKSSLSGTFNPGVRAGLPNSFLEFTPDIVQTKAKKLIAKVDTDSNGNTKVYQYVFNHLVMQSMCIDGLPCIYPAPY
jgi:hypothetical protein